MNAMPPAEGRRCRWLLLAALTVAVPVPSWGQAEPPAAPVPLVQVDPFQSRVAQAAQLLDADPQAAVGLLDHLAVESIEMRKVRPLTPDERLTHRQLFTLRARAHLDLMNNEAVEETLRELLRVDPFFPGGLPPRAQEVLDGIRTRESGLLEVTSTVRDCRILLDGIEIGVTGDLPVRVSLVAGAYQLRLEKPGHQGVGARVTMVPGHTLTVTDMAPRAQIPPIAFLTDRGGIEVLVDNVRAGSTVPIADFRSQLTAEESAALDQAVTLARFDPRTSAGFLLRDPPVDRALSVRFRGECLVEEVRSLAITADALAGLDPSSPLLWFGESSTIRMLPDTGTLRVNSTPKDADVYVDGQLSGRTPFERNVCTGEHRVRVRHRIGSYAVSATITRGRTEVVDVTLRPSLGILGAVETVSGALRPSLELASTVDRAFAGTVKSFRLATPSDLPPEVQRWSDTANAELVAAADRGDGDKVKRLLRQANENFDAPVLLSAVARGPAAAADTPVDLLLFWFEHDGVDRVRIGQVTSQALSATLALIDRPMDAAHLVYQNHVGMRVADSLIADAPLVVVVVDAGGPAATAGVRPGDAILSVNGTPMTAGQLAGTIAERRPGDLLSLAIPGPGGQVKQASVAVQRRARQGEIFSPALFGNALIAKLQAALATATDAGERDLLTFNIALAHMRFEQWRQALDLLGSVGQVPTGTGVGPGAALYFRARCHQELGERDRAQALLREAVGAEDQILTEDGATVGALARLLLGPGGGPARPPGL